MRKALVLLAIACLLCGLALAGPNGNGAVKPSIVSRTADDEAASNENIAGSGDTIGWAVLNTNANDVLQIVVHLDAGEAGEEKSVAVKLWSTEPDPDSAVSPPEDKLTVGTITPNGQGKATEQYEISLPDSLDLTDLEEVYVQVVVDPSWNGASSDAVPVSLK